MFFPYQNDSDSDGSIVNSSVTIVTQPSHADSVKANPWSGTVTYWPNVNFFGTDSLEYTIDDDNGATSDPAKVYVYVSHISGVPTAADDTTSTPANTAVDIDVITNDSDSDGTIDATTVVTGDDCTLACDEPQHGSVEVNATTGVITYTPDTDYTGSDSFDYRVYDDDRLSSNAALVTIYIAPDSVRLEAELMTLEPNKYVVESPHSYFPSDGGIKLDVANGSSAYAYTIFDTLSGFYDVNISYLDENDGESTLKIEVGDSMSIFVLDSVVSPQPDAVKTRQLWSGLFVDSSDTIRITGTRDNGERGRVDYIEFMPHFAAAKRSHLVAKQPQRIPDTYALMQNYPNPFNPTTLIRYDIPAAANTGRSRVPVKLEIYNIFGQRVRTLVNEPKQPGEYTVAWDGRDDHGTLASSGIYIYRIIAGGFVRAAKMTFLK